MDKINRYSNNFDFLRLAGALLVIFYTSFGILGAAAQDPLLRLTNGLFTTGSLGVAIFFIISGYLITMSWDKRRKVLRFVGARFLRLVPALAGVALFTVFIIGPLTTNQNIWDYITSGITWGYFRIVSVFFPAYNLPGVFTHNFTDRVNGSLWTLPIESTMYLIILIAGALGVLNKKRLTTLLTISALGLYLATVYILQVTIPAAPNGFTNLLMYLLYILSPFFPFCFLIGSVYYLNREKIKFDFRIVLLAAIVWLLSAGHAELLLLSSFVCLPYIVLGTAFTSIPYINRIGKKADLSYGLYIYHYPVQQTLVNFFGLDPMKLLMATLVITVPLAWLSWHLIESRALSLKNIELKISRTNISGISARAIRALGSYVVSIGSVLKAKPLKKDLKGKATILQKLSKSPDHFLTYLYEMRVAVMGVAVLYIAFFTIGFATCTSHQCSMGTTTALSVSGASSSGNFSLIDLAIGIFVNNVLNCFAAMILGIFLGVAPLVFIISNGMTLGCFMSAALPETSVLYIMAGSIPHGLFEIPAILLSSAIGLKLGYSLIRSIIGKKGLVREIRKSLRAFIYLILPIIAIAAVVETFITLPVLSIISNWV
jgi:peptidoglycan/LPS O-acetylase OafA/YrhL/uncharacterized membrane protein SpoIIM required for sporulation